MAAPTSPSQPTPTTTAVAAAASTSHPPTASSSSTKPPPVASTSSSPPAKRRRKSADAKPTDNMSERPRLTEQEKKNNHIASEQKRRLAIREGFDRLTEIVPGLEGQGRSESIVLKKSVDHMREVLQERQQLIERIQALGGEVPEEMR